MEMLRVHVETLKMDGGSVWMDVVNAERTQGKTHQDKQMEIGDRAAPRCPRASSICPQVQRHKELARSARS